MNLFIPKTVYEALSERDRKELEKRLAKFTIKVPQNAVYKTDRNGNFFYTNLDYSVERLELNWLEDDQFEEFSRLNDQNVRLSYVIALNKRQESELQELRKLKDSIKNIKTVIGELDSEEKK